MLHSEVETALHLHLPSCVVPRSLHRGETNVKSKQIGLCVRGSRQEWYDVDLQTQSQHLQVECVHPLPAL